MKSETKLRDHLRRVEEATDDGRFGMHTEEEALVVDLTRSVRALLEAEEESGAEPRGERRTIKDPGWYEPVNERIEALEELGRHNREGVDSINSAWRETWEKVRELEERVEVIDSTQDDIIAVQNNLVKGRTPEPDSEPEPEDERCPACHGIPATNHIHRKPERDEGGESGALLYGELRPSGAPAWPDLTPAYRERWNRVAARLRSRPSEDTARLDWLEENFAKLRRHVPGGKVSLIQMGEGDALPGEPTVREAIDAARTTEEKP